MVTYTWESTPSNEKSVYDNLPRLGFPQEWFTEMLLFALQIAYGIQKGNIIKVVHSST